MWGPRDEVGGRIVDALGRGVAAVAAHHPVVTGHCVSLLTPENIQPSILDLETKLEIILSVGAGPEAV